jgi:drug/metabolite transporter (DMT)-like permease
VAFFNRIAMNKNKILSYLSVVTAMLLWAMSFIWSKLAFESYNPFTVLFFRLSIAGLSLYLVAKAFKLIQKVEKKDFKIIMLLSFFEPFLYFIGENFGLKLVTPGTASILISTIPLFMPLIGYYFFKEKVSINNIVGVTISVIGVLFVILNKDLSLSGSPMGFALLFLAVFAALGYTIVLKNITYKYNAFTIVFWQNVFASIAFLPLFLIFEYDSFSKVGVFDFNFTYIILLALFASNGAFLLYTYALKFFGVAKVGVFTNLIPVFTLIISFYIFNEQLSLFKYFGVLLVIVGLLVSEKVSLKKKS